VPQEILYDNMKQVVIKRGADSKTHRFNESLLDFAGVTGFIPKLCRPYRAKTKGKVERSIGYIKDRFLCGRVFTSVDDINNQLLSWIENHANKRIHATTGEAPVERLKKEKLLEFTHRPTHVEKAKRQLFVFNERA
jgi:transposase